jgi:hypothetical protein
VINSTEELKTIEEIHLITNDYLKILKKNEYFLDYVTGDLYEFRIVRDFNIRDQAIGLL